MHIRREDSVVTYAFRQIYVGEISRPEVRERIENSKLVLHIGALKSDFNTGNFSYHLQQNRTIEVRGRGSSLSTISLHFDHSFIRITHKFNMRSIMELG